MATRKQSARGAAKMDHAIEEGLRQQVRDKNAMIDDLGRQLADADLASAVMRKELHAAGLFMANQTEELNRPQRVLRIIEYSGPRQWVEDTVRKAIHGTYTVDRAGGVCNITATTLHEYPEALDMARAAPHEKKNEVPKG